MEDYLKENITQNSNLIFINAPGLGYEDNYLPSIINCFKKIDITFDNICNIDNENSLIDEDIINWNNKVYFLRRSHSINKLATGGSRNLSVHMQSIDTVEDIDISADIVLLMDDVTTTGNSLYVCKEILLNRGAANVEMFALGKAI